MSLKKKKLFFSQSVSFPAQEMFLRITQKFTRQNLIILMSMAFGFHIIEYEIMGCQMTRRKRSEFSATDEERWESK